MVKYINVRMPVEAYHNWKKRKIDMENALTRIKGKSVRIPMTNILIEASRKPIFELEELDSMIFKRWKR